MKSSRDIRHKGQRFQGSFWKEFSGGHIYDKNVDWYQSCSPVCIGAMCWGESKSTNLLKWSTSLISVNARGLISGKNFCWGHIFDMLRATKFLAKKRAHMRKKILTVLEYCYLLLSYSVALREEWKLFVVEQFGKVKHIHF